MERRTGWPSAVMLPHVVRWNGREVGQRYADLLRILPGSRRVGRRPAGEQLAARLDELAGIGGLPRTLRDLGVPQDGSADAGGDAEKQWTGTFNPRPFDAAAALSSIRAAY